MHGDLCVRLRRKAAFGKSGMVRFALELIKQPAQVVTLKLRAVLFG
jgi:hypothetical protein